MKIGSSLSSHHSIEPNLKLAMLDNNDDQYSFEKNSNKYLLHNQFSLENVENDDKRLRISIEDQSNISISLQKHLMNSGRHSNSKQRRIKRKKKKSLLSEASLEPENIELDAFRFLQKQEEYDVFITTFNMVCFYLHLIVQYLEKSLNNI